MSWGGVGAFAGVLTSALLVAACGPDFGESDPGAGAAAVPEPVVRDSAGIRVVENSLTPVWTDSTRWRLSSEPVLRIGAREGPEHVAYGYALRPVRLSDGRIVVADRQVNQIYFYDASGEHLMTVGRTGQGPGEFTQIWRLYKIQGDSLMVLNPTTLTSIFSPEGDFVRRYDLDPVVGRTNIWWKGRFPDGSMLSFSLAQEGTRYEDPPPGGGERRIIRPERDGFYRDSLLHFIHTGEGRLVDSLMKIPGQFLSSNTPFPPSDAYVVEGEYFHTSPGNIVEIQSWRRLEEPAEPSPTTPAGLLRLERVVRRPPLHDVTITEEMKEEVYEGILDRYRDMAERGSPVNMAGAEYEIEMQTFPPGLPAHGGAMRVDAEGNLWLEEYRLQGEEGPQRWSVFDPDGVWLGVVEFPTSFTLNEIGSDYVLGIGLDELDVQFVEMYRLEKPGG